MRNYVGVKAISDIKVDSVELACSLLTEQTIVYPDAYKVLMNVVWNALDDENVYFRDPKVHVTNMWHGLHPEYLIECQHGSFSNVVQNMVNIGRTVIITKIRPSEEFYFITCYTVDNADMSAFLRKQFIDEFLAYDECATS